MPLVTKTVGAVTKALPKVISPKVHAVIDYATVGAFVLMGALFWKNNRRASIAAFACGAAEATTALLTNFPGGVSDVISFRTHGKIDAALAGATASMPNLLNFGDQPEAKHFRIQGGLIAAVTGLTDFSGEEASEEEYEVA